MKKITTTATTLHRITRAVALTLCAILLVVGLTLCENGTL